MDKIKNDLSGRVHFLDEVRGFAIICMVVYHMFYDIVVIWGVNIPLFYSDFINALVFIFAGAFIFISGAACLYSRNNLKRGAICFLLGMVITAFTMLAMPGSADIFGILHMLGINMMLFPLLAPIVKKIPPIVGICVSAILLLLTFNIQNGYLGFQGIFQLDLPESLYSTSFLFPLGLPGPQFASVDYFPLIPWIFCFYAGSFFGVLLKEHKLPNWFYSPHIKPLAFVGRNTLVIYVLHQPIIYCVLWIIFSLINR